MALVKNLYLELTRQISPVTKDSTRITSSNIGTVDPAKHTKEDVLLFYNDARIALFNALSQVYPGEMLSLMVSGTVVNTTVTFANDGTGVSASRPNGYMKFISMSNAATSRIYRLPETMLRAVLSGTDSHFEQTSTLMFIFEEGSKFYHYGGFIVNAEVINLSYFGLPIYTIADVTGGTTVEAINDTHHPALIELAVTRAMAQGTAALNGLATKLIGAK